MQEIIDLLVSLNIPLLDEDLARLIMHIVLASIIAVVAPAMLVILTWLERKIIARIQDRIGPNRAGPFGLLQGFADMIKMFTKEDITPATADRIVYNIAPGLSVISAIMVFAVIPFAPGFVGADLNVAVLYIVAIGGFGTLAILMGGWASNNKYALLGAFRVVAMLLTYEIPMVAALITVTMVAGSMSMTAIVEAQGSSLWYIVSLPLVFLIFFLSGIAETGRSPFDLIEAESELIAGFHTEYSGIKFGMFMIGEYVHMFALSFFCAVLFMGGWQIPFIDVAALPGPLGPILGFISLIIKVFLVVFVLMWFRGTLPRFRIDHLLDFGWKFLVPLSLALLLGVAVVVRLFSPGSSAVVPVEPGPLSGLGPIGEAIALLLLNLLIAAAAIGLVSGAARRSRDKGLRAVAAVEPVGASGK
ncbi:MAG TPA: NADH-quinone oxidoreductase subunit NuoH [Anaerolineae bacterium]|nr:NADH-quinone oxidoreductase subunit NuoH [Anaerolineae bacterium]